jgi:hypothetical protein
MRCCASQLLLALVATRAAARPPASVYEVYWDAGQPDYLEGRIGNCSDTRDAVDATRLGLRGTDGHGGTGLSFSGPSRLVRKDAYDHRTY